MSEHSLRCASVFAVPASQTDRDVGPGVDNDTGARTRLSPDDRRVAVLDATIPLVIQHGLALTTRQIADAAGVAEGTLFRVFDDKRALVVAAIARALDPQPVVDAVRAVDTGQELSAVLVEVIDVIARRSARMRAVLAVALELRRMADQSGIAEFRAEELLSENAASAPAGSLVHAARALRSRAAEGPRRIVGALTDVLAVHREELRREPEVCARILFSIVSSSFHDPLAPTAQPTPREIVEVFLDGMRARPTTSHTPETPC
jgi:AcrR family transcriptional regulator